MKSIRTLSKLLLSLCFISLITFSCENDDSDRNTQNNNPQGQDPNPTAFAQNFGNNIQRTFLGSVVDSNNNPLEGVLITIGDLTALTDNNGVFAIEDAPVFERFGYVTAKKSGFIHASRSVVPSDGTNRIRIMMLPETIAGTTTSGTQHTISLSGGASVKLEGDYIKEDGSSYSGSVNVIMHHLDPTDENMTSQMPGMLYAANAQNEARMLQTFGMLAVELRGDGGEDLNLAEGSSAEIRVPLDASLIGNAPSTIPLWYFDETHGYWIEDGQATLVGNEYIGTVTHFSFWNCDIPAEYVTLCINVTDENSEPISDLIIRLSSVDFGTTSGVTNYNGQVCGIIPSNVTLDLSTVGFNECLNESIYSETIGPFSSDSTIDISIVPPAEIITETITGTFNDCSGNPITNGYVILNYGGSEYYEQVSNGDFEISFLRCQDLNTFSVVGVDLSTIQESDSINYTFTTPATNIGSISSCNDISEFIQFTIDSPINGTVDYLIVSGIEAAFNVVGDATVQENNLIISSFENDTIDCFYLYGILNDAPHTGQYDNYEYNDLDDTGISLSECQTIAQENNNIIYNVTNLGAVGEYIDINFSGSYEDWAGTPYTINGIIHVIRDN